MSTMNWKGSDGTLTDEDFLQEAQSNSSRKRSSRACDQCRKTKSKCERGEGDKCKSCQFSGSECTFLGPSYKRGPPKGYIHAIEQRWHQVEALLGSVLQCRDPGVQGVVADLRRDDLAREILNRVDTGPYGPTGRRSQPEGASKEDFFASILKSNETFSAREAPRSRRQSRVSREIVSSSQDHGLSVVPTLQWQDNLAKQLESSSNASDYSTQYSLSPAQDDFGAPSAQRRRLNNQSQHAIWDTMYPSVAKGDEVTPPVDPCDAIGQLSLDEEQELRYHSRLSGLDILSRADRTDNRIEGGIWHIPMARMWPPSKNHLSFFGHEEDVEGVELPPIEIQDRLIQLYMTHIHPAFPVLHKTQFLREYEATKDSLYKANRQSPSSQSSRPDASQKVTKLLLFSIFAISARFSDFDVPIPPKGKMWEGGCDYLDSARKILDRLFHRSRPTTVQALLLLGYREFGIGSMEQGWIFIGMAIRMAIDLGMNCDTAKWKSHGKELFSSEETQLRRQIWWTCMAADRYGSVYMGRPISIHDHDFDIPLPDIIEAEEESIWQPLPTDPMHFPPVSARILSCFRASSTLTLILGHIITSIYPVRPLGDSRREAFRRLESSLDQWLIDLPENLRYDPTSKRPQPPHVVFLHIRYWSAVLLLNRGLIPNWKGNGDTQNNSSIIELKAFDLAQSAASHVSTLVSTYNDCFTLKRTPPFFTSHILNAAVLHILTLRIRSGNPQATLGLQQCLAALKAMEIIWPSAARAWELLHGVKLGFDKDATLPQTGHRHKRDAEDAFGQQPGADHHHEPPLDAIPHQDFEANGLQDLNSRLMAQMLGLSVPGMEPSTSFYPGYEWWPSLEGSTEAHRPAYPSMPMDNAGATNGHAADFARTYDESWLQGNVRGNNNGQGSSSYPYDYM
ncbi:hypothetical protein HGRIS_008322 [Hohenbuehelia grisea]|uniref:Zn(2)-C6 fungal-type domain-containing protein n=1 Tax=Hohenbuehelia grisea TaxID=104357 RepID=A0ABR3J7V6_9AGAR